MTLIKYFLDGSEFAVRNREVVPRQNECVRFNGSIFLIECVVWIEDEPTGHTAIDIKRED